MSGNGIGGGDLCTVYGPSDRIIVLDSLGRAFIYAVHYDGSLRVVSEPDSNPNITSRDPR